MSKTKPNRIPAPLDPWIARLPQINKMRTEGKTGLEIAATFSTPFSTYRKTLARLENAGHPVVPSARLAKSAGVRPSGLPVRLEGILPLMAQGMTAQKIADTLGRTVISVRNDIRLGTSDEQRAAWAKAKGGRGPYKTKKKATVAKKPGRKPSVVQEIHFTPEQVSKLKSLVATGADLDHIRTEMGFPPEASSAYVKAQCSFYISAKEWAEGWKSRKREHLVERAEAKEKLLEPRTGRRNHATNHPAMEPGGIAWAALWNGNPPPYPQHLVMGVFS